MAALLFFLSSFGHPPAGRAGSISVELFFEGAGQGILIILAILMVAIALRDKESRVTQRRKKKRLLNVLGKQKKILENRFDIQKKLSSKSQETDLQPYELQSSLNFAADIFEKKKTAGEESDKNQASLQSTEKQLSGEDKSNFDYKLNESQTNLARILIEGENISSFPPEWQEFLVENEGGEPIDKLNKMLQNGKSETR